MQIVIPTYLREDRQLAYNAMPKSIRRLVTLVTHSGRTELLRKHNPDANVHDLGKTDGIADVRQKILKFVSETDDKVFIIDDSCKFYESRRVEDERKIDPKNFRGLPSEVKWKRLFRDVETHLDNYIQVGISPRPGNNRHLDSLLSPGRAYSCYGINVGQATKIGATFDGMYRKNQQIKLYEDFYFTLYCLTRGYSNVLLYNWGFGHDHGKPGGNSAIRTNSLQKICLEALQREFPRYVNIVQRKAVSWNVSEDDFRWECIVQWKKALTEAINKGKQ